MHFSFWLLSDKTVCIFQADPNQYEARMPNGLVRGHAYSITGMKVVSDVKIILIQ